MKFKLILLNFFLFISLYSFSQVPQGINYQAVARNSSTNQLIKQKTIAVQFKISLPNTNSTWAYTEVHHPTTNDYGLFTTIIGKNNTSFFDTINWALGPRYLEVGIDIANGTNYVLMTPTQMWSVPYALHSQKSDTANYLATNTGNPNEWHLSGNSGTNPAINYIGTKDQKDFVVKTDDSTRIVVTSDGIVNIKDKLKIGVNALITTPSACFEQQVANFGLGYVLTNGTNTLATYVGTGTFTPGAGIGVISSNTDFHIFNGVQSSMTFLPGGTIGVSNINPSSKSILDIKSTSKGVLIPRMNLINRNNINPAAADQGLLIFNTTDTAFNYWDGSSWDAMNDGGNSSPWKYSTSSSTNIVLKNNATDNVGIGTIPAATAKLHVSNPTPVGYTTIIENKIQTGSGTNGGVLQLVNQGNRVSSNIAVSIENNTLYSSAVPGLKRAGLQVEATGLWQSIGAENYGIKVDASGGTTNYGVYSSVIQTGATNWAGYFDGGNVYIKNKVRIGGNSNAAFANSFEQVVTDADGYSLSNSTNTPVKVVTFVNGTGSFIGGGIGTATNNDFQILTNNSEKLIVKANGDVGIGISNPTKKLDVAGDVIIPAVNNYLYKTAKTNYYSISPVVFKSGDPQNYTELIDTAGFVSVGFGSGSSAYYLYAPINLPDGSTLLDVTVSLTDNSIVQNFKKVQVLRNVLTIATHTIVGSTIISTTSGTNFQVTGFLNNHIVNNATASYYIRIEVTGPTSDLRIHGASIRYTVTRAD